MLYLELEYYETVLISIKRHVLNSQQSGTGFFLFFLEIREVFLLYSSRFLRSITLLSSHSICLLPLFWGVQCSNYGVERFFGVVALFVSVFWLTPKRKKSPFKNKVHVHNWPNKKDTLECTETHKILLCRHLTQFDDQRSRPTYKYPIGNKKTPFRKQKHFIPLFARRSRTNYSWLKMA